MTGFTSREYQESNSRTTGAKFSHRELQRTRTNEQIQRENERLDRFASVVSHDLRNPLSVVTESIDVVEETGDVEQFVRARRALDRMSTLIDDLLTLARTGTIIDETETVALDSVVDQCWETVSTGDATLVVRSERTMRADRTRVRQLLENLLRNAVEHGRDDVTVTVGDLPDGFFVADDGPGIRAEDREAVFESGYTTIAEGTGFGLAIVTEVADAYGWDVSLTDSVDGGARFEVTNVEFLDD